MGVEPKNMGKPPKSSILIGFSIIFTIHFGVPLFLETPIYNKRHPLQNSTILAILCDLFGMVSSRDPFKRRIVTSKA